jgi:hypothetical protein
MEGRRQLIFNAASDEEIMALVQPYKYDAPKMEQGKTNYNNADAAVEKQKLDYIRQFEAKAIFDQAHDEANDYYIELIVLFRLALAGDPLKLQMLGLDGRRPRRFASWLRQVNRFYNNAIDNQEILPLVAEYGVTNEKLIAGKELVKKVEIANDDHDKARGTAQQSTVDRNKTLKILDEWTFAFKKVCRLALKDRPQLLEKLGIVVLSEGYKRKTEEENEEPAPESEPLPPAAEEEQNPQA